MFAVTDIRTFNDFTPENDPFCEHDFAFLEVEGGSIFFKVDYYDRDCNASRPTRAIPPSPVACSRSRLLKSTDA